jgi:pentatricopeptide repeat protein
VAQVQPLSATQQANIISQKVPEVSAPPIPQQPKSISTNFEAVDRIADGLFKDGRVLEAIHIYQKMIEEGYSADFDISGLGNFEHSTSRYEWFAYRWYDGQRTTGKIKGNAFDALSLCFSVIRNSNVEEANLGILWY